MSTKHQIERVTKKADLRPMKTKISLLRTAVSQIEYALWKNRNCLPITVEIFLSDEQTKQLRRKYENAGYDVHVVDRWPSSNFTIS